MQKVIHNLKNIYLLKENNLHSLRSYISAKYPHEPPERRAFVLADAIHRIIEGHLVEFSEDHRSFIRKKILKDNLSKGRLELKASHVLAACLNLKEDKRYFHETLAGWLNKQQNQMVSPKEVSCLIKKAHAYDNLLEDDLELLANIFEETSPELRIKKAPAESTIKENKNQEAPSQVLPPSEPNKINTAVVPEFVVSRLFNKIINGIKKPLLAGTLGVTAVSIALMPLLPGHLPELNSTQAVASGQTAAPAMVATTSQNILPKSLRYTKVDLKLLKTYLIGKNSLLAEEPYFSTIQKVAREFDLNPLLLWAITGQEQAFVPSGAKNAEKIANNPFNVYNSWTKYNTEINDSARIAARTIVNLSKDRPEKVDPILWINRKYAEDPKWWVGVTRIFNDLRQQTLPAGSAK